MPVLGRATDIVAGYAVVRGGRFRHDGIEGGGRGVNGAVDFAWIGVRPYSDAVVEGSTISRAVLKRTDLAESEPPRILPSLLRKHRRHETPIQRTSTIRPNFWTARRLTSIRDLSIGSMPFELTHRVASVSWLSAFSLIRPDEGRRETSFGRYISQA